VKGGSVEHPGSAPSRPGVVLLRSGRSIAQQVVRSGEVVARLWCWDRPCRGLAHLRRERARRVDRTWSHIPRPVQMPPTVRIMPASTPANTIISPRCIPPSVPDHQTPKNTHNTPSTVRKHLPTSWPITAPPVLAALLSSTDFHAKLKPRSNPARPMSMSRTRRSHSGLLAELLDRRLAVLAVYAA
jgi:hypothetical protein